MKARGQPYLLPDPVKTRIQAKERSGFLVCLKVHRLKNKCFAFLVDRRKEKQDRDCCREAAIKEAGGSLQKEHLNLSEKTSSAHVALTFLPLEPAEYFFSPSRIHFEQQDSLLSNLTSQGMPGGILSPCPVTVLEAGGRHPRTHLVAKVQAVGGSHVF